MVTRAFNTARIELALALVATPVSVTSIGFLLSGSLLVTAAAVALAATSVCAVYKGLHLMGSVESGLETRTLQAIDPDWEEKKTLLEWILTEACYRWQVSEFGHDMATREFRFLPNHPNANTAFGLFQPLVDLDDLGRKISPEELARAWRVRKNELEDMMQASPEAFGRLNDIMVTISMDVAPLELTRALLDQNRLNIASSHSEEELRIQAEREAQKHAEVEAKARKMRRARKAKALPAPSQFLQIGVEAEPAPYLSYEDDMVRPAPRAKGHIRLAA